MILKFNDATEIQIQRVTELDGRLQILVANTTPEHLRVLFTDPLKTKYMRVEEREQLVGEYEGYTEFFRTEEYTGKIYGVVVNQVGKSTEERLTEVENEVRTAQKDIEDIKESGGSGIPANYDAVLAMAKISAMAITDDVMALSVKDLYDTWSGDSVEYKEGTYLLYNDVLYKVLKDHTSQTTWTPDTASSLYAKVLTNPSGGILPWEQPDSTNPYMEGDKVTHNGKTWESTADNNVWEPGTTGAPWKETEK